MSYIGPLFAKRLTLVTWVGIVALVLSRAHGYSYSLAQHHPRMQSRLGKSAQRMVSTTTAVPSWAELQNQSERTQVGKAMALEGELRKAGKGAAHVHNKLRQFESTQVPAITLFRDHAAWCPYCQKTVRDIFFVSRCSIVSGKSLTPFRLVRCC